jgi:hypothetical protein
LLFNEVLLSLDSIFPFFFFLVSSICISSSSSSSSLLFAFSLAGFDFVIASVEVEKTQKVLSGKVWHWSFRPMRTLVVLNWK